MSKEAKEAPWSPPAAYDAGPQGRAKTRVSLVVVNMVWSAGATGEPGDRPNYFRNAGDYWDWRSEIAVGEYTTGSRSQR